MGPFGPKDGNSNADMIFCFIITLFVSTSMYLGHTKSNDADLAIF